MPAVNIEYSTDTGLHIGQAITVNAGSSNVKAVALKDTLSYAKLEKSGCQIGKDGLIYLRYDLYLLPEAPGFNDWYITAAEQQAADIANEISTKGKVYEDYNTPYLCVFVSVPSTITADEVKTLGNEIVNKSYAGFIANRNVMTSVSELRPVLKAAKAVSCVADSKKSILTKYDALVALTDDTTISELNPSNADTKSIRVIVGKQEVPVYAGDPIDVGSEAIDRNSNIGTLYTQFAVDNPANATGILDTVEIWANTNMSGTKVGTFSGSGTSYDDRDYETIGAVTAGSKQTFSGLSIDVVTGDFIGYYCSSGFGESSSTGYSGVYRASGDKFGGGANTYTINANITISLYATGETTANPPTVTNSTGESNVTATAARLNGGLTDDGGATTTVKVYWGDNDGGTTAGNWDNNYSLGTQAEGTFYHDVSSLSSGTTYYYRYYASNSYGGAWASSTESFLTKPAAPTNVSATDGTHTDKVVITWTKSTGATGYKIYEGSNLLDTVGDVATFDDTTAAAPTITAGSAVASDGTYMAHVALSLSGASTSNGASRTYKVVAVNATGDSADSSTDTGYRGVGSLTYQWQMSAGDSDASYSNLSGATSSTYNATEAPSNGDGRYFKCILNATGAAEQTSTADRGYRALTTTAPTITNSTGASNIEDTTARLNGNLTDNGNVDATVWVYWGDNDGGTTAENWDNSHSLGVLSEGACYYDVSGLATGTTHYYRFYVVNSEGSDWADSTASFLTKPAAPTGVSATDGTHTDKVVITWTKSTGATGYKIYRGGSLIDTVGDVAMYDDTTAAAATITAGAAVASDGTSGAYVALSLSGNSISNGASGTYKVVAVNATGDSADSSTDTGYKGYGTIAYQWQVSAADSDANYSDIIAGTTASYNYTAAPDFPDARYYKCTISAVGASPQTTTADRGYKADFVSPTVSTVKCLGFGDNWAILMGTIDNVGDGAIAQIGIDYGLTTDYNSDKIVDATKVYVNGDSFVVKLENLTNATVYHYRAKAFNGGWGFGSDLMFSTKGSPVIYEYLNTGNDGNSDAIYDTNWSAQSFTIVGTGHTITSVNLFLKRVGNPGAITVSLKHANESLLPTGDDIATADMDGDLIGTVYDKYKFTFKTEEPLIAGNAYAVVVKANVGDDSNYVLWASDAGGALDNGIGSSSANGGITWSSEAPADYLFEIWGNPSISVEGAAVFQNYHEDGDMLFLIAYKNIYAPYYPYEDPMKYFTLQILDTDGLTVLHQIACKSWEYMPTAIYLSANTASSITSGGAYYIRLYGNFAGNPSASYVLTKSDWIGSSEVSLKQWIWSAAYAMENYYDVILTTVISGKTVLNETGGAIFNSSIPLLGSTMPDIFLTIPHNFQFEDVNWVNAFENSYDWEDMVGTQVSTWAASGSELFGVDAKTVVGLGLLALYLIVGVAIFSAGHTTAGLGISFPFIVAAGVIGVIDITLIAIIGIIMAALFVWSMFWK